MQRLVEVANVRNRVQGVAAIALGIPKGWDFLRAAAIGAWVCPNLYSTGYTFYININIIYIYIHIHNYTYIYILWNFHSFLSWWAWRLDLSCHLGSPCFPMVLHVREVVYHLHLGRNYWFTSSGGQRCGLSHWWEKQQRRCCWWLLLKRGCFAFFFSIYIYVYIYIILSISCH